MNTYDPISPERLPQTTKERKESFLYFLKKLSQHPADEEDTNRMVLASVKNGSIPWNRTDEGYTPEEYNEKWGCHTSYFITIFINTGVNMMMAEEEEMREALETVERWEPTRNYPSDGSKGQAQMAKVHQAQTIKWFLCEWDGEWKSENHPE